MEVLPGHPSRNTRTILTHVSQAAQDGIDLVVFPEMAVPGYLLGDEWERPSFLRECESCGHEIRAASRSTAIVFGNVGIDWTRRNEDGRVRKYNAAFAAVNGEFTGPEGTPYDYAIKTLLPNYREFDDSRHFCDVRKLALEEGVPVETLIAPLKIGGLSLGCVLCEDAWDMDYAVSPLRILAGKKTDLLLNLSASPFTRDKNHKRNRVFSEHAERLKCPLAYVNHVGIQNNGKTVFTFDGGTCLYDGKGGSRECAPAFETGCLTFDMANPEGPPLACRGDSIGDLAEALLYGTGKFLSLCRAERVTVGISGGIDSAVVAALYRRILPPENLLLVNMPGPFNSRTTRDAAHHLAEALGCRYAEISIETAIEETRRQIDGLRISGVDGSHPDTLSLSPLAFENVQARDRSSRILAGVASAFGGVFTCNANKSEMTVGYTTLYGDLGGYLANIADLWKTDVYALAAHLNTVIYGRDVIPRASIDIPPSAELSADQNVDEGKGDPIVYAYHDALFRSWVERWERAAPADILQWYINGCLAEEIGCDPGEIRRFETPADFVQDLEKWWNLYQGMGLAKRIQAPPVLAVTRRAFGFDHREAQLGPLYTREYQQLKAALTD